MSLRLLSLFSILFLIGCGDKADSPKSEVSKAVVDVKFELESDGAFDPIANPKAVKGGTLNTWGGAFPKSLNQWLDYNSFSKSVSDLMYESLVDLHSKKDEPIGILAKSWTSSEDGLVYTFKVHPQAKWSDGKKITAGDFKFYYDTIMNPKNLTSMFRVDLSKIEVPEVIDENTIKVTAKTNHWKNFWIAAGLVAFPKHLWEGKDFNKINFDFDVVSGPYKLGDLKKGRSITLERRGDWWGQVKRYNQYKFNVDKIRFKSIEDRLKALELFKKGDLDFYPIYTAKIWAKQTEFEAVQKNWVVRQRVYNKEPLGFQGLAFNMRRPMFQDLKVRKALAYMLNRDLMNEKYMYNQYFMLNSYFPDLYNNNLNKDVELIKYDPVKARQLFKEAGWVVNGEGKLEKDGKPMKITMITASSDLRHASLFKEHLKEIGVELVFEKMSWSTLSKRMDQHEFDVYWAAWGATRLRDPESMWHSSQADEVSTNNITGVKDKVIDELIEMQRTEKDLIKRNEILKKIDKRLNEIHPYAFLWAADFHRLLYWNKFGTPKSILDKFNDANESALKYWYVDPAKEKSLEAAKQKGEALTIDYAKEVNYSE